ncbi:MAG: hypothetical protein M1515_01150 [Candidatus Thermoplasmatota archaeon]|nr:hypothetical protein [Candidatus Thermoplasmatota archaeon]
MNLKHLFIAVVIVLLSTGYLNIQGAEGASIYPTLSYTTYQGYNVTITDAQWVSIAYPVIYSSNFSTYNWKSSPNKDFILFDTSLTGLNPYGGEFIEAMEVIGNFTTANVTLAFKQIAYMDATGDGYSNQEKLNAGALPGFYNSTPYSFNNPSTRSEYGYVLIAGVIASVAILYFVFNRKKDE